MASAPAGAESLNFNLRATVPVSCFVRHTAAGAGPSAGAAVALGQINEFCNAPGGYEVVVSYAPGTLRGAVLSVGNEQVVLNGSGQAVLSRAQGPRIRERALTALPGAGGFDTDRIDFRIQPL
ncbi:hypothetical protein RCO27_17400 [Sphingosinicella sp. LHD-64]|uniref:hypothetical protein n=1 Tax=Sphingosinicella sp. LHD-64 TaxID=3072139 RepID=UPI00280D2DC3|nr:hypothetical protein [Sphingosinicella sp. LHD-64]MDQ8758005.1 hypothetical protein [Sphingosinicella sp. LHD-64]